jgi:hypothetical protein
MTAPEQPRDPATGRFMRPRPGAAQQLAQERRQRLTARLAADANALIPEDLRTPPPEPPEPAPRPAPRPRWPTLAEQRWQAGRRRWNELLRRSGLPALPDNPPSPPTQGDPR